MISEITHSLIPLAAYVSGSLVNVIVKVLSASVSNGDPGLFRDILLIARMMIPALIGICYFLLCDLQAFASVRWFWYVVRATVRYSATYCTYYGIAYLHLQVSAVIGLTEPFFVMFLSTLVGYESFSLEKFSWLVVAFFVSLMTYYSCLSVDPDQTLPIFVMFLANFLAATSALIGKRMAAHEGDLISATMNSFFVALCAIISVGAKNSLCDICAIVIPTQAIPMIFALGIIGGLHTLCFQIAIRLYQPSFVSSFQYSKIFFGIALDWIIFGYSPNAHTLVSALCVLIVVLRISSLRK